MSDASSRLSIVADGDRIVATGEIDAHSAPTLVDALTPLPAGTDVVLDLSGIEFMDSSGLRVVIDAHQRAEADQRALVIVEPSKAVHRLIEISGLADHLHIRSADRAQPRSNPDD